MILHFLYLDNLVIHWPGRSDEQHVCELSLIKMFIYGMHCCCLSKWIQQTFKITSVVTMELVLFISQKFQPHGVYNMQENHHNFCKWKFLLDIACQYAGD